MPLVSGAVRLKRFTLLRVVLVLLLTGLTIGTIHVTTVPIKKMLDCQSDEPVCQYDKRVQSIVSITTSLVIAVVAIAGVASVLNVAGVHTGSILAGAGIIGLVIGLGAQSVIKDVVTGILIISENQISVGDYVELTNVQGENIAGTVTALSVRIMKLQKQDGSLAFVPSGNIAHIANFSRTSQVVTVAVDVPLTEDVRGVSQALQAMAVGLYVDPNIQHLLVSAPELQAVQALTDKGYSVRIHASVKPGNQWAVGRYIRLQAIQRLQDLQVEAPRVYVNLSPSSTSTTPSTPKTPTSLSVDNESKTSGSTPAHPSPAPPTPSISPAQSAQLAGLPKMTVVL